MIIAHYLQKSLIENGHLVSEEIQQSLLHYLNLLHQWNRVFNLTAIRDPNESVILHLLDSLSVSSFLEGNTILDVGTGAGLPGIPLALIHPQREFVLLDSNNKKIRFLFQVIYDLKIKNVQIIHARAENFQSGRLFDMILSRAFASLPVMLNSTQHLLKEEGRWLAMKGMYPEKEIEAIPAPFTFLSAHRLEIKGLAAERHAIVIGKKSLKEA